MARTKRRMLTMYQTTVAYWTTKESEEIFLYIFLLLQFLLFCRIKQTLTYPKHYRTEIKNRANYYEIRTSGE